MNQEDRDMLIRIDERVKALKDGDNGAVPDILRQLGDGTNTMKTMRSDIDCNARDITWIKRINWGIITTLVSVTIAYITAWVHSE